MYKKLLLIFLLNIFLFASAYDDAMRLYEKRDYKNALKILLELAKGGDAIAQNDVGVMYESGQGTTVNYKTAEKYYEKSAKQGNSDGEYNLGLIRKSQKRYSEAIKLFKASAKQGNEWGEHYLGIMYQHGKGIKRDYKKAIKFYKKSVEKGNYLSQSNLALMYEKGKGVRRNYKEAIRLYTLSAKQNYLVAQYNLGMLYYLGAGVPQNKQKAKELFQQSCDNGHGKGCTNLKFFKK